MVPAPYYHADRARQRASAAPGPGLVTVAAACRSGSGHRVSHRNGRATESLTVPLAVPLQAHWHGQACVGWSRSLLPPRLFKFSAESAAARGGLPAGRGRPRARRVDRRRNRDPPQ